jgi:hypothetical protein
MNIRPRSLSILACIATVFASLSTFGADKPGQGNENQRNPANPSVVAKTTSQSDYNPLGYYGVGTTPAVYLVNFLIMYIASPDEAAKMPAYRAPIPSDLADCLNTYPDRPIRCSYSEYALSFDDEPFIANVSKTKKCSFPEACRSSAELESLAPPIATSADQLNEPLGLERANSMAKSLNVTKDMILTDVEWECTQGTEPQSRVQELITSCLANLTNSNGNTNIPLSSYGLALNDNGDVQSLCAPKAPCLEFNYLFYGPLERLAFQCGWLEKLQKMREHTPFPEVITEGNACQTLAGAGEEACLVQPVCP